MQHNTRVHKTWLYVGRYRTIQSTSLEKSRGPGVGFRSSLNSVNILMNLSGVNVKLQIAYIGFRQAKPFYPTDKTFSNNPNDKA